MRNQIKQFTKFFRVKNILNSEGNETLQTENFVDKFEYTQNSATVKENVQAQANAISFTMLAKNLTIPGKIARQPFLYYVLQALRTVLLIYEYTISLKI